MTALLNYTRHKPGLRTPTLNFNKPIDAVDLANKIEKKATSQIFANCWTSSEGTGTRSRS